MSNSFLGSHNFVWQLYGDVPDILTKKGYLVSITDGHLIWGKSLVYLVNEATHALTMKIWDLWANSGYRGTVEWSEFFEKMLPENKETK